MATDLQTLQMVDTQYFQRLRSKVRRPSRWPSSHHLSQSEPHEWRVHEDLSGPQPCLSLSIAARVLRTWQQRAVQTLQEG